MPKFTTPNGVEVLFDNNILIVKNGDGDPLLDFDKEGNLKALNFNGYRITPIEAEDD